MIKIIKSTIYLCGLAAIILQGCTTVRLPEEEKLPAAPQTFNGQADTTTIADIKWRVFFTDATLVKLIDTAVQNNLDVKVALQRVLTAKAGVRISEGAFLPSVDAVLSAGADKYGDYTMNGVGNYDTNLSQNIDKDQHIPTSPTTDMFLGLRSSWEIDVWAKLKNRKKAAYARYLASQKGRQWVTTQLVAEVARLYYDLVAQDDNLEIVRRNIQLQEKALDIVKAQKEGGRATELAVQQFNAQLLHTRGFEYEIRQNIASIENALNVLLGRYPQPVTRSASITKLALPQQVQAGIPSGMLTRRADIQAAELELIAARASTQAARKAFLPSFTITPYLALNAFNPSLMFSPGSVVYGALGGLTAPLLNKYQLKAGFAVASAEQATAAYNYQKNILQGFNEVVTNLQALDNYKKFYQLKQDEASVLFNAVTTANELYLNGAASYLEVITAQKGVLDAELEVIIGKKALFVASIDLYRSLGGGWE